MKEIGVGSTFSSHSF